MVVFKTAPLYPVAIMIELVLLNYIILLLQKFW